MNAILKKAGRRLLTGLKIAAKLVLLLPIPVYVVWFNVTTAKTAQRRTVQYEWDTAQALLQGETLYDADLINSRLTLQQLIEGLTQPFDTIALGSSRILQMSTYEADGGSFYNCGLSGADYRDIMNTFYLFDKADMLPKNVIIGLDPWILNSDPNALHHRSDADLFEEFITLKLGYTTGYSEPEKELADYTSLLSPLTFRENLALSREVPEETEQPKIVQGDSSLWDLYLKRPDGSEVYQREYRESTQETVNGNAIAEAMTFLRMAGFEGPDPELCILFHQFVQYMKSRDVNVILFMSPYHPIVYDFVTEHGSYFSGFFLVEPWFAYYAREYDIPLYGSYNPYVTQHTESDFYDGLHIKGEAIPNIFPGVQRVISAQQRGNPSCSPWLDGRRLRIEYSTALHTVRHRYSIPDEETTKQAGDTVIKGELCYTIERYGADGKLVAQYAVNRRNGLVWRYDTDLKVWLTDLQFPGVSPL